MKKGFSRTKYFLRGLLLLALFPGAFLLQTLFEPSGITLCFFKTVTGYSCPFCGLTRAFAAASCGNYRQATTCHPAWWIAACAVILYALLFIGNALTNKNISGHLSLKIPWLPYFFAGSVFAAGILRCFF